MTLKEVLKERDIEFKYLSRYVCQTKGLCSNQTLYNVYLGLKKFDTLDIAVATAVAHYLKMDLKELLETNFDDNKAYDGEYF